MENGSLRRREGGVDGGGGWKGGSLSRSGGKEGGRVGVSLEIRKQRWAWKTDISSADYHILYLTSFYYSFYHKH